MIFTAIIAIGLLIIGCVFIICNVIIVFNPIGVIIGILLMVSGVQVVSDSQSFNNQYYKTHNLEQCILTE